MSDRLDRALADRGLARSRTAAARLIEQGAVRVNGRNATKVSQPVFSSDEIEVVEPDRWVSRGAYKLLAALESFDVEPTGQCALDLGASTGGFTQVLLERGAREVVALDVGHDQLNGLLRADVRVTVIEGENARYLDEQRLNALLVQYRDTRAALNASDITLIVGDLSFISLRHILPTLNRAAPNARDAVLLVKPQFEVGRKFVRGGIVTDTEVAKDAVTDILRDARDLGWSPRGFRPSPVTGTHGNYEYLLWLSRDSGVQVDDREWDDRVVSTMTEGVA